MRNAVIHSTGTYVPERVIKNEYFDELLGTNVSEWLEKHVQIFERRWCAEDQSTADLAIKAAQQAMKRGNVSPEEIDLLIIATDTPEFISPSTASKVQFHLDLTNAGSFDINTACAGYVTGVDTAVKFIKADENYNTVMVIGVYAMSKYLNMLDKKTVNLFADGAGCVILKSKETDSEGYLASKLITKGEYHDYMGIYAGGTRRIVDAKVLEDKGHLLQIAKKFPPELNPQMWAGLANDLSERTKVKLDDVKMFFFTQININSIYETMKILNQPMKKAQTSMHHYGYTGSACIPLAFEDAVKAGKLKRGDVFFMIGSGGGLSFAGAAFRY